MVVYSSFSNIIECRHPELYSLVEKKIYYFLFFSDLNFVTILVIWEPLGLFLL